MDDSNTLRNWFQKLEGVLGSEAELAGLLGHSVLKGDAREFFVTRALNSVLPPAWHLGSGRIINAQGDTSKQVDIVVYDPFYPVLEAQPGMGIYLAEGVIAAIEVKSTMTKKEMLIALDNCYSVAQVVRGSDEAATAVDGQSPFLPVTYIFAFQSVIKTHGTLAKAIEEWWDGRQLSPEQTWVLPRVTVAGKLVGVAQDRWYRLGAAGSLKKCVDAANADNKKLVLAAWESEERFAWLLMHVFIQASQRFSNRQYQVLPRYIPVTKLIAEEADAHKVKTIYRPLSGTAN